MSEDTNSDTGSDDCGDQVMVEYDYTVVIDTQVGDDGTETYTYGPLTEDVPFSD